MYEARTYGIDANATCGIVQSRALGEPNHAVLGGLVCSAFGAPHQSANRRAVDDRATSLLAHLAQLKLHATPHATEVDGHHTVKVFPGSISGFRNNILNAGIVVSCIKPPEGSDSLFNHCLHLSVISYIALDSQCFVALASQFLGCRAHCFSIPIRKRHCSTGCYKGLRRGKA